MFKRVGQQESTRQKSIENVWRSTETVECNVKQSLRSIFWFRRLRVMSAMPVVPVVLLFLTLSLAACSETEDPDGTEDTDQPASTGEDTDDTEADVGQDDTEVDAGQDDTESDDTGQEPGEAGDTVDEDVTSETDDTVDTESIDQPVLKDKEPDDTEAPAGQDDTEFDDTVEEPGEAVDTVDEDDSAQQPTDQAGDGDTAADLLSDDVPSIEMIELSSGESVSLRSLVDGERPVLLWFWAPHCPICRGEAPDIEELAQENSHRLKVVGVGAFDDLDYAHRFVADTGTTFTMLWSESAEAWRHYGVRVNSHFWILDANGNRVGTSSQAYNRAVVEGLLEDIT